MTDYGIQTEKSDYRSHVSVVNRCLYVFETREALATVERLKSEYADEVGYATQPGVGSQITGVGWKVPVESIGGLVAVDMADHDAWNRKELSPHMTTTEKGRFASHMTREALRLGLFPLRVAASESQNIDVQLSGVDIIVDLKTRIQVKCDWRSGCKPKGTGNVFIQFAEINPLSMH